MSDKIKEAIELLGKAKKEVFEVVASEMVGLIIQPIEDSLSLLKQPCETTSLGNSIRSIAKSIRSETDRNIINQAADRLDAWWAYIQELKGTGIQPDCSPSAEVFVKRIRSNIKAYSDTFKSLHIPKSIRDAIKLDLEQACDLLIAKDKTITAHAEIIERLKEALSDYGEHAETCTFHISKCSCGLNEALEGR